MPEIDFTVEFDHQLTDDEYAKLQDSLYELGGDIVEILEPENNGWLRVKDGELVRVRPEPLPGKDKA